MSLTSIVFSKNRPAQLDLLLRSMKQNAPAFTSDVRVIFKATTEEFWQGYVECHTEHGQTFAPESPHGAEFHSRVEQMLATSAEKVAFFVDDDVIYRPLPVPDSSAWLDLFPDTLCFSLRLGLNTTQCYPLRSRQDLAEYQDVGDFIAWDWREDGTFDFSYPSSLDGHIFRRDDLLSMLEGAEYGNPNQLEEVLVRGCQARAGHRPNLAAFEQSVLVGIPANSVSETHGSNRSGETHHYDPAWLNNDYLAGRRLAFPLRGDVSINAAHVELPLLWEDE